jgi:aromatic ring-cleaving dioxygenase
MEKRLGHSGLALDVAHHLRYRVFRRNSRHLVHLIQHQMGPLEKAFLLLRRPTEHFSRLLPKHDIQRAALTLWYEHHVVEAFPLRAV